jgi:hypothetical protein
MQTAHTAMMSSGFQPMSVSTTKARAHLSAFSVASRAAYALRSAVNLAAAALAAFCLARASAFALASAAALLRAAATLSLLSISLIL